MNVEIGTEAVQLPEKEYINGIFLAVWISRSLFPFLQGEAFTMLARQTLAAPYSTGQLCRWFRFAQLAKGKKSRP